MALAEGLRLLGEGTPRDQVMARRLVEVEDAGQAADRTSAQKKVFNRTFTRDDIMGLSAKEREKYKAKQSKLQSAMSTFHTQVRGMIYLLPTQLVYNTFHIQCCWK